MAVVTLKSSGHGFPGKRIVVVPSEQNRGGGMSQEAEDADCKTAFRMNEEGRLQHGGGREQEQTPTG